MPDRQLDLLADNRRLRTAIVSALARRPAVGVSGIVVDPWWWPLEDVLGIPRTPPPPAWTVVSSPSGRLSMKVDT
jgi:hypothetical protein